MGWDAITEQELKAIYPEGGLAMTDAADSHARSMVLFCNIAVSFHPTGGVKSL